MSLNGVKIDQMLAKDLPKMVKIFGENQDLDLCINEHSIMDLK